MPHLASSDVTSVGFRRSDQGLGCQNRSELLNPRLQVHIKMDLGVRRNGPKQKMGRVWDVPSQHGRAQTPFPTKSNLSTGVRALPWNRRWEGN